MNEKRPAARMAVLGAALVLVITVVVFIGRGTRERIERNEHAWFVSQLDAVLANQPHDNVPWSDRREVVAPELGNADGSGNTPMGTSTGTTFYRARLGGRIVAIAFAVVAPGGYRGPMTLLVGVSDGGEVLGVRVLAHQETPGLGDGFAARGSTWLLQFTGRSLRSDPAAAWSLKKEGGEFDQFTGASITPRAIVNGVRHALEYVEGHRKELFGT